MFYRPRSGVLSQVKLLITAGVTALAVLAATPATADSHSIVCPSDSLQVAIDAASPGDSISVTGICDENIVIDKDLSISGGSFEGFIDGGDRGSVVTIESGVGVTLDGLIIRNGRAVQGGGILNHGHLYIHDSRIEGNVLFDGLGDPSQMAGAGIFNAPGATLRLREVWVTGNEGFSGAGGIENAGDATLEYCWIQQNWSLFDAGGVENRGTMDISRCEIADNLGKASALDQGPGGVGNWGTMTISLSTIRNNITYEGTGGGIKNAGTLRLVDSEVFGNHAPFGGGVFVTDESAVELLDSSIHDNSAGNQGGGLYLDNSTTAWIDDTVVWRNRARTGGGGASVRWGAVLTGQDASFDSNSGEDEHGWGAGGGIFVIGGTVELTGSTISFNSPAVTGGGISMTSGAYVSLIDSLVSSNEAAWEGGGIHNYQSTLSLTGSTVNGNTARDGGGLSSTNGEGPRSTLTLTDSEVYDNHATRWGGGVYNVAAELDVSESAITGNSAGESGGGLFNKRGAQQASAELRNTTIADNSAPAGAGVLNNYGQLLGIFVTVTDNTGSEALGGVFPLMHSPNILMSILAANPGGDCESDVDIIGGYSVIGDCTISSGTGDLTGVDDPQLDPQFAPDGHLQLYVPRPHSPAVDLVQIHCYEPIDQRYTTRPIGAGCDAGSIERELVVDAAPPSVAAGFPAHQQFTQLPVDLWGTASDDVAVASVRVAVRDRNTGLWLGGDGTSWGAWNAFDAYLSDPYAPATGWFLALSLPDGQYNLALYAKDASGNQTEMSPWHPFQVAATDTILPTVDADYAPNTVFNTDPIVLTGTAADNVGVARVWVAIRHRVTGAWLQSDMVSYGPYYRFLADLSVPDSAATNWSFEVSLPDGGYTTSIRAVDLSGNEQEVVPWRRFEVGL